MREADARPLRLYWVDSDGGNCEPVPGVAPSSDLENGILIHDFDPAFAPNGSLVFASTRGNLERDRYSYSGPTRTPAAMQPNANLYVLERGDIRQLTFLLNQEVSPSFMADGRVIFTTEKREPGFHQLALRRQNLDGGDYHPLFAQRPSIGFASATEVVELPNRNLAFIAAPLDAVEGAGALAIVNRSIGPDQSDPHPLGGSYLHSLSVSDVARVGPVPPSALKGLPGVFRSPAALPGGRVLVSCDMASRDVTAGSFGFSLCELDPRTGALRTLTGAEADSSTIHVDPVAVYARPDRGVFGSAIDEPNGHTEVIAGEADAVVHVHDLAVLSSLLFENTRTGRPVDRRVRGADIFEALPPPPSADDFSDVSDAVTRDEFGQVYVRRELLGAASAEADGSVKIRVPGGVPILLALTDAAEDPLSFGAGRPFTGEMVQREEMQFYPGERSNQSFQARFFNGLCAGCHGSLTGRELDIAVSIDILSSASRTLSSELDPVDLTR
jgi:hypothetical protein